MRVRAVMTGSFRNPGKQQNLMLAPSRKTAWNALEAKEITPQSRNLHN
jgi:hypothetical protein